MHKVFYTILLLSMLTALSTYNNYAQAPNMSQKVTLNIKTMTLEEVLDTLSSITNASFIYNNELIQDHLCKGISFINMPFFRVLDNLFLQKDISYRVIANQIILFYEKGKPKLHRMIGKIQDAESFKPIAYAAVGIKNTTTGAISDYKGNVELILKHRYLTDTMYIACVGYETREFPLTNLRWNDTIAFNLQPRIFEMPAVVVNSADFEVIETGNNKLRQKGSLYLDTHGQQVALYIPNENKQHGIIRTLNYYLADDGNTDAPFRIRLYEIDSISGKPGKDLLNRILIAKPEKGAGWYKANITEFYVHVPEHGFFAAMEGIYPNDYEYYITHAKVIDISKTEKKHKNKDNVNLAYGQRIGYNKKENENTWHYSLSHTWFQLTNQPYGVMISASLELRKTDME